MNARRALLAGAASLVVTTAAAQQVPWYATGVKRRDVHFVGDGGVALPRAEQTGGTDGRTGRWHTDGE